MYGRRIDVICLCGDGGGSGDVDHHHSPSRILGRVRTATINTYMIVLFPLRKEWFP